VRVTSSPRVVQCLFGWTKDYLSRPQFLHIRIFVIGVLVTGESRLKALAEATSFGRHRTSLALFLSQAQWNEQVMLEEQMQRILRSMKPRKGEFVYLLIDDTRIVKRSTTMDDVSKLWDHSHQRFARGHMVVTVAVRFRGVTLPWRLQVWQPKAVAGRNYVKTTEIAAAMIREFQPPRGVRVRVLFDAFYLCAKVTNACNSCGFTWFSVASKNRKLIRERGRSGSLKSLAPGILKYSGHRVRLKRDRGWRWMRITSANGRLAKIGDVRVVFSKRPRDPWNKVLAVATNELARSDRDVIEIYEKRWNIEVLFKELRSELGLGDYRMQTRKGIRRHLHLVCLAHLVLTHHSLKSVGAKARQPNSEIPLPRFQERITHLRDEIRRDQIRAFTKKIRHDKTRQQVRQFLLAT